MKTSPLPEIRAYYKDMVWYNKINFILTILELPATILHEFSHIIVALLTFSKIKGVRCNYFYLINAEGLNSYSFTVEFQGTTLGNILTPISPVFVIFGLVYLSPWTLLWIIPSIRGFWLSDVDIQVFLSNFLKK